MAHCSAVGCRRDSVTILFDLPVTRTRDLQLPVHSPGFITVKYDMWMLVKSLILVELGGIQLTMEPTVKGRVTSKLWTFFPILHMLLHQIEKCPIDSYL